MDREKLVELFRRIHELGGCDVSEDFDHGWDAAIASCEDVFTEVTGIGMAELEED